MKNKYLDFSPGAAAALAENKPVVALESTIIAHGMPYPENVAAAREVEAIVRENGAVPATIAVLNGKIKIGLDDDQLDFLGRGKAIAKVSRRDLPYIVTMKKNGAVTVSGTMICASMAGIDIMVTGGIGGVHRGVQDSWDISADLTELMNTSVAVVCSGVKSILDIEKTLEVLETFGVPVIGYRTDDFPAFYTRKSGLKVDFRLDSPSDIAAFITAKGELGLSGGVLVANPVPKEHEADGKTIDRAVDAALKEAEKKGIKGKQVTPFLLEKIRVLTMGESLKANIALVKNNARLGAAIARTKK
jgi:pseudouridine-5'-phosphate glycosidase